MAFCGKCGTKIEENVKFCPSCGNPAAPVQSAEPASAASASAQNNFGAKLQGLNNTADTTAEFDPADIQQSKAMGILAYLSFLVLIPLFAAKNSRFARYHTNQGLILFIVEVAYSIVYGILNAILLAISWRLAFIASIIGIVSIVFLILAIIGIVNVVNGRAKALPIIGKFKILK